MASVRKAVITAAGHGTRQYPATHSVQKELLPLVDIDGYTKPTLQIILEDALEAGIEELCVIANPANAEPIRAHFRGLTVPEMERQFKGKEWAFKISESLDNIKSRLSIVVQHTQEGYGHAVYQAREWVGNDAFVLLLGDHVYAPGPQGSCIQQIVQAFDQCHAPVSSVERIDESKINRYGTAAGDPIPGSTPQQYTMKTMAEKPSLDFARANLRTPGLPDDKYLCIYGVHALTPDIFDCLGELVANDIRQNGEIQFAAAQKMLSERRQYVLAELTAKQYDMGIPEGLLQTQLALALASPFRGQVLSFIDSAR
jgi:UTP--glucose-1-phosphate uridylyltransferase